MIECVNQISTVDTRSAFVDSKQTQSKLKANIEWTQNNLNFCRADPKQRGQSVCFVGGVWTGVTNSVLSVLCLKPLYPIMLNKFSL